MFTCAEASFRAAFLTGLAIALPVLVLKQSSLDGFLERFIIIFLCLLYILLILKFVVGEQYWDKYRWRPVDGVGKVIQRSFTWLFGGVLSVGILEGIHII